jgi:hypothetical protein
MRLLDQVAQAHEPVRLDHPGIGRVELPGANRFASAVRSADSRFVMARDLCAACSGIILDQPELLLDCLDIIRVPSQSLWLEWRLGDLVQQDSPSNAEQRAGVLVETDESGRRGTLHSFWESEWGPDAAPGTLYFDLDRSADGADPNCIEPLNDILSHTTLKYHPEWEGFYRGVKKGSEFESFSYEILSVLGRDALLLLAFSLTSSMRSELTMVPSQLGKLNKARSKRGAPALLDFTEVNAALFAQPVREDSGPGANNRTAIRLHHVRGHFVRRSDSIFWRRPHLRGDIARGLAPARVTRLSMYGGPR